MISTICLVTLALAGVFSAPADDSSAALEEFTNGNRLFTAALYKELLKNEKDNFVTSPFSAEVVLALTTEGARGQTAQELTTGLSLPSTQEKTQKAMQAFLPKLKPNNNFGDLVSSPDGPKLSAQLQTANKIYAANDIELEPAYKKVAVDVYQAGIENVDFADNVGAANTINHWVEGQTNNRIKDLISADSIDDSTKLVLVNALYFKAPWASPFEEYGTQKKKFYKSKDVTTDVDMMQQTEYFNYYENKDLHAKFLELPYAGTDVSMVICLPDEIDGLASLEQNMEEVLKPQPFTRDRVEVHLPKFKIETTIPFVPILKNLGIKQVFESSANLTGISTNYKNLYVSEVIQKAFIEVNEAGTEAAAATAVKAEPLSIKVTRIPKYFNVNRPFLYSIRLGKITLFIGKIRHLSLPRSFNPNIINRFNIPEESIPVTRPRPQQQYYYYYPGQLDFW